VPGLLGNSDRRRGQRRGAARGLKAFIAFDCPQHLIEGNWTEVVTIDEAASEPEPVTFQNIFNQIHGSTQVLALGSTQYVVSMAAAWPGWPAHRPRTRMLPSGLPPRCGLPLSFLLSRWRGGPPHAFRLGATHGAYCVGCCWLLMLTGFAVGLMNLAWMALITLVLVTEQAAPGGVRLGRVFGAVLAAWGAGLCWPA
jgi:Predicted metal-binding integral membrane protein (DUF2182)